MKSAWAIPIPRIAQIDTDYYPHCNICGHLRNLWEYHVPRIEQIDTDYIIHRNICGICEICEISVRNHVPRITQTDTDYYPHCNICGHLRNQREKSCPTDNTDGHRLLSPLQHLWASAESVGQQKDIVIIVVKQSAKSAWQRQREKRESEKSADCKFLFFTIKHLSTFVYLLPRIMMPDKKNISRDDE